MKPHWIAFILVSVLIAVVSPLGVGHPEDNPDMTVTRPMAILIYAVGLAGVMYINGAFIAGVLTLILKWRRPHSVPRFGKLFAWSTVSLVSLIALLFVMSGVADILIEDSPIEDSPTTIHFDNTGAIIDPPDE